MQQAKEAGTFEKKAKHMNTTISGNEHLHKLAKQVAQQNEFLKSAIVTLPLSILKTRPQPHKWHILECITHLNQYSAFYIPYLEKAAYQTKVKQNRPFKSGWLGNKFIKMMAPENVKPQKTMKHMDTYEKPVSDNALEEFLAWQERLIVAISNLENTNLNKRKIPVEFFKLIKMKVGDALEFVIVHQQRHLNQIEKIVEDVAISERQERI